MGSFIFIFIFFGSFGSFERMLDERESDGK